MVNDAKRTTEGLVIESLSQWCREQQLSCDSLDRDTSLIDLGIDSLGVATLAGQMERELGKRLKLEAVFDLETVGELADYLDSQPVLARDDADQARPVGSPAAGNCKSADAGTKDPLATYRRKNMRVEKLKQHGMYFFEPEITELDGAWVVADGRRMLMLGSYEYLGLLGHPRLNAAMQQTVDRLGTGHHGVRLLAGTTDVHRGLEAKLASFMGSEAAIVFSSGYVANMATVAALLEPGDCVIGDQWNHASIVDGCRMSGARFLTFAHNDMQSLEQRLAEAGSGGQTLVIVDGVFSMDGDITDAPSVAALCRQYGALLMVDEAHSLGVIGATGRGVQEHFGLPAEAIDIKMGTLSKSLAGCGGFVAAKAEIVTYLRHHARGYIFSGALPSPQAAVAHAALEVIESSPEIVRRLHANLARYMAGLKSLGFDTGNTESAVVPVMTRTEATTLEMTRRCRADGLLVIPVAYPAVPMDAPRLRTTVTSAHTFEDIDFALSVLARQGQALGLISAAAA